MDKINDKRIVCDKCGAKSTIYYSRFSKRFCVNCYESLLEFMGEDKPDKYIGLFNEWFNKKE
jgi:hypothetical protein